MARSFASPSAFRQALEDRLKRVSSERGVALNTLRQRLLMERFLARLFAGRDLPWLLKGGFALELLLRPRARTTRDVDLAIPEGAQGSPTELDALRERLQEAAERDLGDFFVFRIGTARTELRGAPRGGARFPVEGLLAGRPFGQFHVDVGFGDPRLGPPEDYRGDDLLSFAGIPPGRILTIPMEQQFAEKVHAYTRPRAPRSSTRTKDLIDLVLLVERTAFEPGKLRSAIRAVFEAYRTHAVPGILPPPPAGWEDDYALLAEEVGLAERNVADGFARVAEFWRQAALGHAPA